MILSSISDTKPAPINISKFGMVYVKRLFYVTLDAAKGFLFWHTWEV